jgi:hypothetical protein
MKILGAFFVRVPRTKNRAIRSNLFYRFAIKKDFRFYPLRGTVGIAKQSPVKHKKVTDTMCVQLAKKRVAL